MVSRQGPDPSWYCRWSARVAASLDAQTVRNRPPWSVVMLAATAPVTRLTAILVTASATVTLFAVWISDANSSYIAETAFSASENGLGETSRIPRTPIRRLDQRSPGPRPDRSTGRIRKYDPRRTASQILCLPVTHYSSPQVRRRPEQGQR